MKENETPPKESCWTLEQIYAMYKIVSCHPGNDFSSTVFWSKMIEDNLLAPEIRNKSITELLTLWEYIMLKTNMRLQYFKKIFRKFEWTFGDNSKYHAHILKKLHNIFVAAKGKIAKDIIKESPTCLAEGSKEEEKMNINAQPVDISREFRVISMKRFGNIDLNDLYNTTEGPMCSFLDVKDKKQLEATLKGKREIKSNFLKNLYFVNRGRLPHRLLNIKFQVLSDEDSGQPQPMDELYPFESEFNKTREEIRELNYFVSGDLKLLRQKLEGREVPIWNELEDLALEDCPPPSKEFEILQKTHSMKDIERRRKFLGI